MQQLCMTAIASQN